MTRVVGVKQTGDIIRSAGSVVRPRRPMKSGLADGSGFSIVELMIALTILAIGVLSIATLFDNSYKAGSSARALTKANRIAQTYMEQIISSGFAPTMNSINAYAVAGTDIGTLDLGPPQVATRPVDLDTFDDSTADASTFDNYFSLTIRIDEQSTMSNVTEEVNADAKVLITVIWTDRSRAMDMSGFDSTYLGYDTGNRYVQYEGYI